MSYRWAVLILLSTVLTACQTVQAADPDPLLPSQTDGGDSGDQDDGESDDPADSKWCTSGTDQQHPRAARIASEYEVEYEEVIAYFCDGYGFGQIDRAYASGDDPASVLSQNQPGGDDHEQDDEADGDDGRGRSGGQPEGGKKNSKWCRSYEGRQHNKGAKLAREHDVPYEEIMDWFCAGYGFGQIDKAYEAGTTPDQLTDRTDRPDDGQDDNHRPPQNDQQQTDDVPPETDVGTEVTAVEVTLFREQPFPDAVVIRALEPGTTCTLLQSADGGNWLRVECGADQGWVYGPSIE